MTAFADAKFTIRAVNQTEKAFAQIQQSVDRMDKRFGKLGSSITSKIGPAIAGVFAGREIINTITTFEKLEASLRTVTGSAENASVAFNFIQDFAATTPFELEEVTAAFIKLKSLGLTPSEDALRSYGNTASAMGKSLNQMIEAVADATTGEFERLKEFGIRSKTQGDQVTFTFQGVSTTVRKNAADIEKYLRSIGDVQFAGAMDEQANTLNVALSNMKDSFAKLVKAIGDAGLTDILMGIANGVKWLAEQITAAIEPFKLGFKAIIAEVVKFGRLFIAVFEGVGDAFNAFGDAISARFEALGKDLAAFVENPLGGVSFENTRQALETGLLDAMGSAFDKAMARAREFNAGIDAEVMAAADKLAEARQKKNASLADMFEQTRTEEKQNSVNKQVEKFNDLQREAERVIESTRTPLERYNKEMEQLNKLLEKGYLNQETFGRAVEQANKRLEDASKKTSKTVEGEFDKIGRTMEDTFTDALDGISGRFESFGDFAKGILGDINNMLLKSALKELGVTGEGGLFDGLMGSLGGLFKGGGGLGGLFSSIGNFFGGFFAEGGQVQGRKPIVVGERGAELFVPGMAGRIVPSHDLAMAGAGGGIVVNMNINTPDVQGFRHSQTQIAADMARSIERARRNL